MEPEPYHRRPWAELLFFFGASALVAGLNGADYLGGGGTRDIVSAAIGAIVALIFAVQIWRKIKSRGVRPFGNKDRTAS